MTTNLDRILEIQELLKILKGYTTLIDSANFILRQGIVNEDNPPYELEIIFKQEIGIDISFTVTCFNHGEFIPKLTGLIENLKEYTQRTSSVLKDNTLDFSFF